MDDSERAQSSLKRRADDVGDDERRVFSSAYAEWRTKLGLAVSDDVAGAASTSDSAPHAAHVSAEASISGSKMFPDLAEDRVCAVCWAILRMADSRGTVDTWSILRGKMRRLYKSKETREKAVDETVSMMRRETEETGSEGLQSVFRFLPAINISTHGVEMPSREPLPCVCVCQRYFHYGSSPTTKGLGDKKESPIIVDEDSTSEDTDSDTNTPTIQREVISLVSTEDEESGSVGSIHSIHPWQSSPAWSAPESSIVDDDDKSSSSSSDDDSDSDDPLFKTLTDMNAHFNVKKEEDTSRAQPHKWDYFDASARCGLYCATCLCTDPVQYAARVLGVPEDEVDGQDLFQKTMSDEWYTSLDAMHSYLFLKLFGFDPTCIGTVLESFPLTLGAPVVLKMINDIDEWVFDQWDASTKRWSPNQSGSPARVLISYMQVAGTEDSAKMTVEPVVPTSQCVNALLKHYAANRSPKPIYDSLEDLDKLFD